ncbi:Polysulphide reductase NrfD [Pyrolobus fumarii 1A]|uniref:Polysulphide reductase NrfD n=1 Tax=Pyrolobus fumarii (strain DSM 11204 / 1A) TaxID=694429 RepID=G0EFE7_PYRF1|nr:NrfD/PsrC family molybdoenzyme membrane anchor subunit [Pyrolobus fumarii]AEM38971.1 Polysulphide reductase NrfD [Pyrolobus fumarii 1A]
MAGSFLETIIYVIREALFKGSKRYYMALLGLALIAAYGIYLWIFVQHAPIFLGTDEGGMIVTGLSDSVPWGIYISFFVFWVGVAAAGIVFGIAAYVFGDKEFKKVAALGEVQAVAAVITALSLVYVDLGRPIRGLFLMPQLPNLHSMFDYDFLVLTGYLTLNLIGVLVTIHYYRRDKPLPKKFIVPFMIIAAPFAIGIHTVTAFISQALTARPIWHSPLLAPRYVATAFASGPAILLLALYLAERYVPGFKVDFSVYKKTTYVMVAALVVGLYFTLSEVHEIYWYTTEALKKAQANELFFGYHLPYLAIMMWLWIGLGIAAVILGILPRIHNTKSGILLVAVLTIVAVICEKTMTVIIPGFVPDTLGQIVPYYPTPVEIAITIGVHAIGMLVYLALSRPTIKAIMTHYMKGGEHH